MIMVNIILELIIIACLCNGLMLACEEGMIFYKPAKWIKKNLSSWLYKPTIGCIYCMASLWGVIIHVTFCLFIFEATTQYLIVGLPIIILCGVFVNGLFTHIYNKLSIP